MFRRPHNAVSPLDGGMSPAAPGLLGRCALPELPAAATGGWENPRSRAPGRPGARTFQPTPSLIAGDEVTRLTLERRPQLGATDRVRHCPNATPRPAQGRDPGRVPVSANAGVCRLDCSGSCFSNAAGTEVRATRYLTNTSRTLVILVPAGLTGPQTLIVRAKFGPNLRQTTADAMLTPA